MAYQTCTSKILCQSKKIIRGSLALIACTAVSLLLQSFVITTPLAFAEEQEEAAQSEIVFLTEAVTVNVDDDSSDVAVSEEPDSELRKEVLVDEKAEALSPDEIVASEKAAPTEENVEEIAPKSEKQLIVTDSSVQEQTQSVVASDNAVDANAETATKADVSSAGAVTIEEDSSTFSTPEVSKTDAKTTQEKTSATKYATIGEGIYVIQSEYGTVLDVAGGETANFTNIWSYTDNGSGAQRFKVTVAGTDKNGNTYYTITAVEAGKVLDVYSGGKADNTNVEIYTSNGTAAQQWYLVESTTAKGESCLTIVGAGSGKALDVAGKTAGANVRIYSKSGNASQNWIFRLCPALTYTTIEEGTYVIESEYGTVLDIAGGDTEDFTNVQGYTDNGSGAQRFQIAAAGTDKKGNTLYTIMANEAKKMLDCYWGGTSDDTNISIYTSNGTAAQKWYVSQSITAKGEASYILVNSKSGKALDLSGTKAGSNVRIWTQNGKASQNWILNLVPALTYTTIEEGAYVIQNESGKSLDVTSSGTADFTNVQTYSNSETAAQRFNIKSAGTDKNGNALYTITNVNSKKALDCYWGGTSDDTNIAIYVSNNTDAQKWYVSQSTTANGKTCYIFINAKSGKALDVNGTENKSNVRIFTQNGSASQNWILKVRTQTMENGAYIITSAKNEAYAVDIDEDGTSNGDNVEMTKKDSSISQAFALSFDQYSGYYTIVNYGSGRVLEVANGSAASGANVQQNTFKSNSSQLWRINKNANGTYSFINSLSNKVLDVSGGTVKDNANLQVYTNNGTAAQQFKLAKTVPTITSTTVSIVSGSNPNLVLDVCSGSTSQGAKTQLYSSNNSFSQTYRLEVDKDGSYTIRPIVSGLYLSSGTSGYATQEALSELYSQNWVITPTDNGHFTISTADKGKVLGTTSTKQSAAVITTSKATQITWNIIAVPLLPDGIYTISPQEDSSLNLEVSGNSLYAGANIKVSSDSNSNGQKFIISHKDNDTYAIYGAWSALALDVSGGTAKAGANVQQYYGNGTNAQLWTITWRDGAFIFKSHLGEYALSTSSSNSGANVQLASYNEKASKQRFLLMQTSMTTPSTDEIIEVLDVYAKGDDLTVIKSMNTLSQKTLDDLWGAISDFWAIGTSCGFTIIDLVTGAGLTYNSDTTFYSACSIKGPYSMALAQYEPSALWAYEGSFWAALDYSNNETYQSYFYNYGRWPLENYKELGHVENFTWTNWTAYYTAEDLCRMWVVASDFLLGDTDEAEWLRDVLSNNSADLMRASAEWWDAETTYAKSGWIDFARTEGSLVIASGDHLYAVGMMSSTNEYHDTLLYHLAYYLCQAMDELVY